MAKAKRSDFKTFLNTGTTEAPVWSLLGEGITTGSINYNPQTTEETYIHQDSGTTLIDSYRPTFPVDAALDTADTAMAAVEEMRQQRAVGVAAETEIVNVWLYEAPVGGEYPAERQRVNIQFDTFGGDGGGSTRFSFTINYVGDPTFGTFNPTGAAFTPNP